MIRTGMTNFKSIPAAASNRIMKKSSSVARTTEFFAFRISVSQDIECRESAPFKTKD